MKIQSLTIPEDTQQWPRWLEQQLLSQDLGATILELEILAGDSLESGQSLSEVTKNEIEKILQNGMMSVDSSVVCGLLRQPSLLLELQERILVDGGDYWQQQIGVLATTVPSVDTIKIPFDSGNTSLVETKTERAKTPLVSNPPRRKSLGRPLGILIAIAASILVIAWISRPVPPAGWGFNRPGALTASVPEDEFLNRLADASHSWFKKALTNSEDLTARLKQFDAGCQSLIDADLLQLSDGNRQLVKQACRTCRSGIAKHLASIDGDEDFDTVLVAANKTITNLENAIRDLM